MCVVGGCACVCVLGERGGGMRGSGVQDGRSDEVVAVVVCTNVDHLFVTNYC